MPIPPRLVITASQVLWHHFHHGLSGLYVSTATLRMGSALDLQRSDNPICAYTLRCLFWACKLDAACNGVWCFIVKALTEQEAEDHGSYLLAVVKVQKLYISPTLAIILTRIAMM